MVNGVLDAPSVDLDAESATLHRRGVGSERFEIAPDLVEPRPGMYDFAATDRKVAAAARSGSDVLGLVVRTPGWAARDAGNPFSARRDDATYAAFVRTLIARYAPSGGFWAANFSWRDLRRTYAAGVKGSFDVAAVHPFSGRPSSSVRITRLNRAVMARNGDRRRPIWPTELTWSSAKGRKTPLTQNWETTEAGQAARLREAYRLYVRARRSLGLGRTARRPLRRQARDGRVPRRRGAVRLTRLAFSV
jgi:hypothetical protein